MGQVTDNLCINTYFWSNKENKSFKINRNSIQNINIQGNYKSVPCPSMSEINGFVLISVELCFVLIISNNGHNLWGGLGVCSLLIHIFLFNFHLFFDFCSKFDGINRNEQFMLNESHTSNVYFLLKRFIHINTFVGYMVMSFPHFFYIPLASNASKNLPIYRCHFMQKSTRNGFGFESTIIKM